MAQRDNLLDSRIACLGYEGFPCRFLLIALITLKHPINMAQRDTAHFSARIRDKLDTYQNLGLGMTAIEEGISH